MGTSTKRPRNISETYSKCPKQSRTKNTMCPRNVFEPSPKRSLPSKGISKSITQLRHCFNSSLDHYWRGLQLHLTSIEPQRSWVAVCRKHGKTKGPQGAQTSDLDACWSHSGANRMPKRSRHWNQETSNKYRWSECIFSTSWGEVGGGQMGSNVFKILFKI